MGLHTPILVPETSTSQFTDLSLCKANAPIQETHAADHELLPGTAAIYMQGVKISCSTW